MKLDRAVQECLDAIAHAEADDARRLAQEGTIFIHALAAVSPEAISALLFAIAHPETTDDRVVDAEFSKAQTRYMLARDIWIATANNPDADVKQCFRQADQWIEEAGLCP